MSTDHIHVIAFVRLSVYRVYSYIRLIFGPVTMRVLREGTVEISWHSPIAKYTMQRLASRMDGGAR